jgi:hypothetical protein
VNHQGQYDKLIERARTRPLLEDYFEFHHVIPRCMDGMDDPMNLGARSPQARQGTKGGAYRLLVRLPPDF